MTAARKTVFNVLTAGLLGLAVCVAPAVADDIETAAAAASQGMRIYIDPQTGAIRDTPAPGTAPMHLSPSMSNARSTRHRDLVQVPNDVPGGGVRVNLQGRFRSPLVATVDKDGKLRTQHLGASPAPHGHNE